MALKFANRPSTVQRQRMRPGYRMLIGLNLLRMPVKDLHEEIKKQVETNPALADCNFSLPPGWMPERARSLGGDNAFLFENRQAEESLYEHLARELAMSGADGALRDRALEIIGNLDENGRYAGDGLDADGEAARRFVMTLDPAGCGAKSLAECYMAQLDKIPARDRELAAKAIGSIDDILAGKARLTPELQLIAARLLGCLDAKPGLKYGAPKAEYIVPDIIVDRDGAFAIEHGTIPEIRISPSYLALAHDETQSAETRAYAKEMIGHVKDLRSAVVKRFSTLEKLAEIVVSRQGDYLLGRGELRELQMNEVAKAAGCDRSTVSRAAERKYLRSPRGLVRLRDLFVSHDTACRKRFAEIMQNPDLRRLSDSRIAALMNSEGYKIARRTVNSYRNTLSI